jgi:hypothetical protein
MEAHFQNHTCDLELVKYFTSKFLKLFQAIDRAQTLGRQDADLRSVSVLAHALARNLPSLSERSKIKSKSMSKTGDQRSGDWGKFLQKTHPPYFFCIVSTPRSAIAALSNCKSLSVATVAGSLLAFGLSRRHWKMRDSSAGVRVERMSGITPFSWIVRWLGV